MKITSPTQLLIFIHFPTFENNGGAISFKVFFKWYSDNEDDNNDARSLLVAILCNADYFTVIYIMHLF